METTNTPTLTGLDTLRWIAGAGAKFCKVSAHNSGGDSAGKAPFEDGWQEKPYTVDQVSKHLQSGGNVGMIAGRHSNGLCFIDADRWYAEFVETFPELATGPHVEGGAGDRSKVIVHIIGDSTPRKLYIEGEKHPFCEFLATGNQGVIAGTHPKTKKPYRLIVGSGIIPTYKQADIDRLLDAWNKKKGGRVVGNKATPKPDPELTRQPEQYTGEGDHLREQVEAYWSTYRVFDHFGFASDPESEKGELRLKGNGGLLVKMDGGQVSNAWSIPAMGKGFGGGPFQAWQYCKNGNTDTPTGRGFYELLCEMATAANIPIPEHKNGNSSPVPETPPLDLDQVERMATAEDTPSGDIVSIPGLPAMQKKQTRWTAQELAAAHFEDPKWAVPGLIPVGLTFLAGRPKVGKSWLALQIAQAVGTGGRVFDKTVEQGKVFYLALEDNGRRLQERSKKQRADLLRAEITFETSFKALGAGGLNDLYAELLVNDYRLVIIDTLARALGGADQMDPAQMTTILGTLQQIALQREIAILMIDHHRKSNGFESDPIDDIANSTAKAAVADGAMGLYRERGKRGEGLLKVRGRDMDDQELALKWDPELCCWQCLGDADQVREDTNLGKVYQALIDLAKDGQLPTTDRTADYLELKKPNVSALLNELVNRGQAIRGERAGREVPYYALINGLPVKGQAI